MGHRLPIVDKIRQLIPNANVFIYSYRGYGKSEGEPHEQGIKEDAQAALDYLKQRHPDDSHKIIVYGQSIGGAVAIHLTATNQPAVHALIVENTFLSLPKLIPSVMPIAKYFVSLCTEVWPSEKMIRQFEERIPVLFLSSARDELIPVSHMQELFDIAPVKTKIFASIPQGTHNDPVLYPEYWVQFVDFWSQHVASSR